MEQLSCPHCLSNEIDYREKGPHRGAYCAVCGTFIKWVKKYNTVDNVKSTNICKTTPAQFDNDNIPPWETGILHIKWKPFDCDEYRMTDDATKAGIMCMSHRAIIEQLIAEWGDFAESYGVKIEALERIKATLIDLGVECEITEGDELW